MAVQAVLVRIMTLSAGASEFSFALIVGVFVLALGAGSLAVSARRSPVTTKTLAWNLALVSAALLCVYASLDSWGYGLHVLRVLFRPIEEAYPAYQIVVGCAVALMLVLPLGLWGATLPLCFALLRSEHATHGVYVGRLYGANTVGCVLGALAGGHFALYFVNLDTVFAGAVVLVALMGIALVAPARAWAAGAIATASLALVLVAPAFAKERFLQPFRYQEPTDKTFHGAEEYSKALAGKNRVLAHRDGPSGTAAVVAIGDPEAENASRERGRALFVNGKADGATMGPDRMTTRLLGHFGALFCGTPKHAFVVGYGTGITAKALAGYPDTERVDVAEISEAVLELAPLFEEYNGAALRDPKIVLHQVDAYRALLEGTEPLDVVVSEPSNPWVTGVENLYSKEFYQAAAARLTVDGAYVQWIHTYSFNDALLLTVMKTMRQAFRSVTLFQTTGDDYAIVGKKSPWNKSALLRSAARLEQAPEARRELGELGIKSLASVLALEAFGTRVADDLAKDLPLQRVERPVLSRAAALRFFTGESAKPFELRRRSEAFVETREEASLSVWLDGNGPSAALAKELKEFLCARSADVAEALCRESIVAEKIADPRYAPSAAERARFEDAAWQTLEQLMTGNGQGAAEVSDLAQAFEEVASPIARLPATVILDGIGRRMADPGTSTEIRSLYSSLLGRYRRF